MDISDLECHKTADLDGEAKHDPLMHAADLGAEPIPELEFDQTANLTAEAGHDRLLYNAGGDAEPIPELEFGQTANLTAEAGMVGWCTMRVAMPSRSRN